MSRYLLSSSIVWHVPGEAEEELLFKKELVDLFFLYCARLHGPWSWFIVKGWITQLLLTVIEGDFLPAASFFQENKRLSSKQDESYHYHNIRISQFLD